MVVSLKRFLAVYKEKATSELLPARGVDYENYH